MPTLHFKGKTFLQNYHHSVKFHNLIAKKEKGLSKEPTLDDNLIIHGDNLKALKALLPTHAGKVKCVYIDPPYNTGNENWVYNDNVASPMIKEWLGKTVDKDDLTRHDKWCCMMYPRLTLLKELLQEDGVIFVSIDDNESHNLRMVLDEIFGNENFVAEIVWQKKYTRSNDAKYLSVNHEYVLFYAKNKEKIEINLEQRTQNQLDSYSNPDNDERGSWKSTPLHAKSGNNDSFTFTFKNGVKWSPPEGTYPRFSQETLEKLDKDNEIWFGKNLKSIPSRKTFLSEAKEGVTPITLWLHEDAGHNHEANTELKNILNENVFENPKPTRLIKKLIKLISHGSNDVILDSFAGSGTTGHAVLALNREDGVNRKFILVECEDYADKITAERIRRVSKGIPNSKDKQLKHGLGGTFSYYELGEPIEIDSLLEGKNLPDFKDLAKYAFFMATGEQIDLSQIEQKDFYLGSSSSFEVFLIYSPTKAKLKEMALNIDFAEKINNKFPTRPKLVFAPACFMEDYHLKEFNIRFAQLPFEIYRIAE